MSLLCTALLSATLGATSAWASTFAEEATPPAELQSDSLQDVDELSAPTANRAGPPTTSLPTGPSSAPPGPAPVGSTVVTSAPATPVSAGPFYRGSAISYRNTVAAVGLSRAAEPTHNPYYAMQLSLAPRAWLADKLYARGSFDIAAELTQSDTTNDRFVIGDLGLALGLDGFYTVPVVDIAMSAELSASLPTSKASQASTRIMSNAVSLELSRKFGIFSVGYSGSAEKFWNQYTTGSATGAILGLCDAGDTTGCVDQLIQTGRRNANWSMTHGLKASLKAKSWLSFSAGAGVSTAFLYALSPSEKISLPLKQASNERYFMFTSLAASVKPSDLFTIGLGARSTYGQLAPDGSYRAPFVNRFTQLYLDLGLNVAGLISKLKS